jgi:hypothetical protein
MYIRCGNTPAEALHEEDDACIITRKNSSSKEAIHTYKIFQEPTFKKQHGNYAQDVRT